MSDTERFDYPIIYDLAMEGGIDSQGKIKEVWNEAALNNSLKIWLSSYEGDMLRQPTRGGYLIPMLERPLTEANIDQFQQIIRNGFNDDFSPYLQIRQLNIIPEYEKRRFRIYLEVYSPDLKISTVVDERIKARVPGA